MKFEPSCSILWCNIDVCLCWTKYNPAVHTLWFEILRDFVDYRDYMLTSVRTWLLRWSFLHLCVYNLVGSVTFRTHAKIWQSGFFWPTMYKDTKNFIKRCVRCQKHGNINAREAMPLTNNLQVELFDLWGIDYMGPFPKSRGCEYILVAMDYVSKWVEAMPCKAVDANSSRRIFEETILPRFGTPRLVISDGGSHFIERSFRHFLEE